MASYQNVYPISYQSYNIMQFTFYDLCVNHLSTVSYIAIYMMSGDIIFGMMNVRIICCLHAIASYIHDVW